MKTKKFNSSWFTLSKTESTNGKSTYAEGSIKTFDFEPPKTPVVDVGDKLSFFRVV